MFEFPVVDFSGSPACVGFGGACGAPAGSPCEPGCPTWASDDLPLVAFPSPLFAGGLDPVDPWLDPAGDFGPEPF